ncbi:APC family permease [Actinoplanes teichomyceticus]|nr:APC family permease [Actinoplanes teichomyceticus]GIF16301.1 amino acid permease [Actinoplanes teichomyceticus]
MVLQTLAANRLGPWALIFGVLAAAAPLTVAGSGATTGWAVTGVAGIPIGYVADAIALALFFVGFVAMAQRIPNAGAFYSYITHGLGRPAGVAAVFLAIVAYNAMQIGLIAGFGPIAASFLAEHDILDVPWWAIAYLGIMIVAWFGASSIELSGKVLGTLLIAEIAIVIVIAVALVTHPAGGTVSWNTLDPTTLFGVGGGTAMAIGIAGYVGVESVPVFREEAKNPARTITLAIFTALGIIAVLYSFVSWSASVATGPENIIDRARAEGPNLLFNLADDHIGSALPVIGNILMITSLFAAMLAFHHGAARYFYSPGREGVLPRFLGTTAPRSKAPLGGSLLQTGLALLLVTTYAITGWDPLTKGFYWLTVVGGVGVLLLMTITSLAVIVYYTKLRRTGEPIHESSWRTTITPVIAFVGLAWITYETFRSFDTLLGVEQGHPASLLFPLLYVAAAVAGLLHAVYLAGARPQVYRVIGRGAEAAVAALTSEATPTKTRR